jgi:hypothetical protein
MADCGSSGHSEAGPKLPLSAIKIAEHGESDREDHSMTHWPTLALLILAVVLVSCDRKKEQPPARDANAARNEPPAFDRVSYQTSDGKSSVMLVSPDDLEFRGPDGRTQACKYSTQDNTIHFTVGDHEWIFERRPGELLADNGTVYLDLAAQETEGAKARRQRELAEAEQRRIAEERRVDAVVEDSKKPKGVPRNFSVENAGDGPYDIAVTDVSFQARQKTPAAGQAGLQKIWYGDFHRLVDGKTELTILVLNGNGIRIRFKTEAQCKEVLAAIREAWNKWRSQYPDAEYGRRMRHGESL